LYLLQVYFHPSLSTIFTTIFLSFDFYHLHIQFSIVHSFILPYFCDLFIPINYYFLLYSAFLNILFNHLLSKFTLNLILPHGSTSIKKISWPYSQSWRKNTVFNLLPYWMHQRHFFQWWNKIFYWTLQDARILHPPSFRNVGLVQQYVDEWVEKKTFSNNFKVDPCPNHCNFLFDVYNIQYDTLERSLIPKGIDCVFNLYRNFGQVCVTRDLYVFVPNFNRSCGWGISFMCTKFQDIWKYESKVMI